MNTANPSRWVVGGMILLGLFAPPRLEAGQIRAIGLEEMTRRADRIFSGRCIATTVVREPRLGLDVTQVTFDVDRAVKGIVGRTVTVRLTGARIAPGGEEFDVPRFEPGERVVLFLYPNSSLGLTSPVGLGQGKFSIFKDKAGRDLAVNALGNKNLLDGASILSPAALLEGARDLLSGARNRAGR